MFGGLMFLIFCREALSGAKFTKNDVSAALALCMAAKEESEITTIKKACQVSVDIFSKYLKEQIMDIIDNDKVSQSLKLRSTEIQSSKWQTPSHQS